MSCSEFQDLISKSLDSTLTPEEKGRLDAHLKKCDACKKEMEVARNIFDACQNATRPVLPSDFSTQVMNRLPKKKLVSVPKVRRLSYIAACLALIVLVSSPALDNLRLSERLDDTGPAPSSTATSTPSGLNDKEEEIQPAEKENNGVPDTTNNAEDQDADKLNQKGGIKSIFGQGQTGGGADEPPAASPTLPTLPQFNHPSSVPVAPPLAPQATAEEPTPENTQSPELMDRADDKVITPTPSPSMEPSDIERNLNSTAITPVPSPVDASTYSAGSGGSASEDNSSMPTSPPPQMGTPTGGDGMLGGSGSGSPVLGSSGGATAPKPTPVYEVVLRRSDEERITAMLDLLEIAYNNDGATLTAQTTYKQYRAILQAMDEQEINYITSNADNPGDWQQVEVVFRFQ